MKARHARETAQAWRARPALGALTALMLLVALLVSPAADAAEGAWQEGETTCSGGSLLTDAAFSLGLARAAANVGGGGPMSCTIVVPAGHKGIFRWYGRSAPETARVDVELAGATVLATTTITRPVSATAAYRVLVWSVVLNAGTTTLTASRNTQAAVGLDYWTIDPDTAPPTTPSGLNATRAGTDATLSWSASSDNVGVTGYRVRVDGGPWTSGVSSPWTHVGGGGSTQTYEVQAYDFSGNVSASGTLSYTPPPDTTAPSTPGGIAATRSGGDVSLTWASSTDDVGVTGYRVRVGTGEWTTGVTSPWAHAGAGSTSQSYEVQAYDAAGNVSASAKVSYVPPLDSSAPTAPGALAVTASDSDLSVSWSASTDDTAVTGYRIRADGGAWVYGVSSPWPHPGAAATSHTYDVQAYDAAGNLSPSASVTYTAPADTTPPAAPTGPSTTDSGRDVLVSWTASTDDVAVTGYRIRVDGGTWTHVVESPWRHVGGAATSQTYEVQAYDAAGNFSTSVTVTYTPPPAPTPPDTTAPTSPGGVSASASGTDVLLSWSPSTDDTVVSGYRVRVGTGEWITSASSPWRHTGGAGTSQSYEVQAYDAAGNLSAPATATYTAPAPFAENLPGTLTVATPGGGGGVQAAVPTRITWSTTGSPGATARVELVRDTDVVAVLAPAVKLATGQLAWTPAHTLPAEATYQIRFTSTSDDRITSTSAVFPVTHPSLTVTSHSAPASWSPGAAQTVTWDYQGTPIGGVRVQLLRRNQVVVSVVAAAPAGRDGRGSATFTPPSSLGAYTDYRIRASFVAFPASGDLSDADITYAGASSLSLASPGADTAWIAGQAHTVSWATTGPVGGNVRLDLVKGGEVAAVLAASVPVGTGSHTWTSPAALAAGTDYVVRVTSTTAAVLFDRVPVTVAGTSLSVDVADPGATWIAGTQRLISWSAAGAPGTKLRLDLVSTTGRTVPIATGALLAGGSLTWTPPMTVVPAGNYRVRALVVGNVLVKAANSVALALAHPTATVTDPSSAQTWTLGAPSTVGWQLSHRVAAPVTLALVRDASMLPVASARPTSADGSGSFTWLPPLSLPPATGFRLRVVASQNPAVRTTSSQTVALRRPVLTISAPAADAVWDTGTTVSAGWQFDSGAHPDVRAELVLGPKVVALVARAAPTGAGGAGTLSWAVPATLPGGAYTLRLRPVATATSAAIEASVPVTVNGPAATVQTPSGWTRGSAVTASWTYARWAGTSAKVELVSGTQVTLLGSSAPMSGGSGSLAWTVPTSLPAATTYRIRVTLPGSATAASGVFAVS